MTVQTVGWALEQEIPPTTKLVLVAIANHANHVDGYCWLKADTIGREASCSPRSVFRHVGALVRNGYLRKTPKRGDDGKQRANDYWILFHRDEKTWDWGAHLDDEEPAADGEAEIPDTQDVVAPYANLAHGESVEPHDTGVTRKGSEIPALSCGPDDSAVTRERIAEPSKTKPEKDAGARAFEGRALRAYQPPPPQPLGSLSEKARDPVFVFEGSRAWIAWVDYKKRTTGQTWSLSRSHLVNGKNCTGWWFPTLFPPDESKQTGPPQPESTA